MAINNIDALPKWLCVKSVSAAKINMVIGPVESDPFMWMLAVDFDDIASCKIHVHTDWIVRNKPRPGGYVVAGHNGMLSYASAEEFDNCHERMAAEVNIGSKAKVEAMDRAGEVAPCCGKEAQCTKACVQRGRWLERQEAKRAAPEQKPELVTRDSALEAISHVGQYNGHGREGEAIGMLQSSPACGACPGDGAICASECKLASESPRTIPSDPQLIQFAAKHSTAPLSTEDIEKFLPIWRAFAADIASVMPPAAPSGLHAAISEISRVGLDSEGAFRSLESGEYINRAAVLELVANVAQLQIPDSTLENWIALAHDNERSMGDRLQSLSSRFGQLLKGKTYAPYVIREQTFDMQAAKVALGIAMPPAAVAMPTDISKLLREYAGNPGYSHIDYADTMRKAADEIERYYGGMIGWKKTAEKKDADYNAERMARIDGRCADRAKAEPDMTLLRVLVDVKHALRAANVQVNSPICDTIWMPDHAETLFDFIDAALDVAMPSPAAQLESKP